MLSTDQLAHLQDMAALATEHGATSCRSGVASVFIPEQNAAGVAVRASATEEGWRLCFDRVEVLVNDTHDAVEYVRKALDGELRVRVDAAGGRAWQWTLEAMSETGTWRSLHAEGVINWRFWGKQTVSYLCNAATGRVLRDVAQKVAVTMPARQRTAASSIFSRRYS